MSKKVEVDLDWPVVGLADLRLDSHPELRFVAIADVRRCSVHALDDLVIVGSLRWLIVPPERDDDSGVIMYIYVTPEMRRRGVATSLLMAANAYAEHYDIPRPRHSEERTVEGDAWARALGAEPARDICSPEELARESDA